MHRYHKLRRRLGLLWLLAICLAVVLGTLTTPALAASDSESEDCENAIVESLCQLSPNLYGLASGIGDRVTDSVFGDTPSPESDADAFQSTVNSNSGDIQSWVNERTNASSDQDVIAATFENGDTSTTVYVTADVNGSDYENLSVDSSTDRTVDESCTLEDNAAVRADDETRRFVDEYASPGADLTDDYVGQLAGRYGKNVDCSGSLEG